MTDLVIRGALTQSCLTPCSGHKECGNELLSAGSREWGERRRPMIELFCWVGGRLGVVKNRVYGKADNVG